ncbi:MAG: glycosyltransferase family 2 protein [Methanomassiliicoccales archaeon]
MPGAKLKVAVIPAFKEELTIASVVLLAKKYVDQVIVVDDGSPDRTSEIADAAGAKVVRLDKNVGKAKALCIGLAAALVLKPDVTVMIDADGQMDPDEMLTVMAPVQQAVADLVIGSRFLDKESAVPKHRRVGQEVLTTATNYGSVNKITDSQSGYRALSLRALQNMDFESSNYAIESEMIVHFETRNLIIVEVPVAVRYDVPKGHKKSTLTHGVSVLEQIISFVGFRRPLFFFGIPAVLLTLVGLILGIATLFETTIIFQWALITQGIAAVMVFGIGLIMGVGALILNALCRLIEDTGRMAALSGNVVDSKSVAWSIKHLVDRVARFTSLRHPLIFFGIPGLVLSLGGLVIIGLAFEGTTFLLRWSALTQGIFGVFLLGVGVLLFSISIVMNSLSTIYARTAACKK